MGKLIVFFIKHYYVLTEYKANFSRMLKHNHITCFRQLNKNKTKCYQSNISNVAHVYKSNIVVNMNIHSIYVNKYEFNTIDFLKVSFNFISFSF